jgi:hypothetical protein
MFYRIQTKTIALGLLHDPACPVFYLFGHGMITKVDVLAHQVIKIPHLIINLVIPAFTAVVINDLKDAVQVGIFNMIDATETFKIPDKLRILTRAGREGVAGPGFAANDFIVNLRAVLLVYTLNMNRFFLICPHFMIHHHVQQHGDIVAF